MTWAEYFEIDVQGEGIGVEHNSSSGVFRLRLDDHTVGLTDAEFDVLAELSRGSNWDLGDALAQSGYSISNLGRNDQFLDDMLRLKAQIPASSMCVFLDTTTIANATSILGDTVPGAISLLDLAVLTYGLAFYDHIVVLDTAPSLDRVGEAVVSLELSPGDRVLADSVWSIARDSYYAGQRRGDLWSTAWANLLEIPPSVIRLNLDIYDTYTDSPSYWDGAIRGDPMLEQRLTWLGDERSNADRDSYLSVITLRTIFNDWLGARIGVPHVASSLRAPIHSHLIQARQEPFRIIDRIVAGAGATTEPRGDSASPFRSEVALPFPLALVLSRMKQPSDYWAAVVELRERCAPLRKRLNVDRGRYEGNPKAFVDAVMKKIAAEPFAALKTVTDLTGDLAPAAGVVAPAAVGPAAVVGGLSKVLGLGALRRGARGLYWRVFRPELHLLNDLRTQSRALSRLEAEIGRVWPGRFPLDEIQRLSAVQPLPAFKLIDLG